MAPAQGVAAVSWGEGRIDRFWIGPEGDLLHAAFAGGSWLPTESLGGSLAGTPGVTAWAVDQLEVFAVFPDGELWNRFWDGASWHAWESLGGELEPAAGAAASSWSADRLDVWATGRDGRTWHRWWDGTRWVDWEQLAQLDPRRPSLCRGLLALAMATRLGLIAAGRHVAPAAPAGPGLVIEEPLAGVVRTFADAVVVTRPESADDRVGDPDEHVVHRIAHVAVPEPDAVGGRNELEPLLGTECPVDLVDRGLRGPLLVGDRVGDLPERRPRREDPIQGFAALAVLAGPDDPLSLAGHAVLDEPVGGDVDRCQSVDVCTVLELVGVQEVERGFQGDRGVDMVRSGRPMSLCVLHHITTVQRLTGYAQEGNLRVTS